MSALTKTLTMPSPVKIQVEKFLAWFAGDPRHYQISFLATFLFYGVAILQWHLDVAFILVTFFTCLITQAAFTAFTSGDYRSLKSAMISALSLCLMLRTNSASVLVLASVLSIVGKFIINQNHLSIMLRRLSQIAIPVTYDRPSGKFQWKQVTPALPLEKGELEGDVIGNRLQHHSKFVMTSKGKHFFNPTNFGIILTLLITGDAWISPGQWGSSALLLFLIGLLGLTVLVRVKRLDTAFAFLITFCSLSFIRNVFVLGWETDVFFHQLTSGTLLLFTFFMITDPVSTPSHPAARITWASLIGSLAFYLGTYEFVNGAPLWALFFLSPTTLLFDKFFVHSKFSWK